MINNLNENTSLKVGDIAERPYTSDSGKHYPMIQWKVTRVNKITYSVHAQIGNWGDKDFAAFNLYLNKTTGQISK